MLNVDNPKHNNISAAHHVGDYYKKIVNKRIFHTINPSPVLKQEAKAIRRYQSPFHTINNKKNVPVNKEDSRYFFRSKSFMNESKFPALSPRESGLGVTLERVGVESE